MAAPLPPAETPLQLAATRDLTGHGHKTRPRTLRGARRPDRGGREPPTRSRTGGGAGAQVTDLEEEVAALTGKPAAVLMPSGIMAQQAALRAWADRSGRDTIGMHAKSHFLVYELDALRELHGLRPVVVTEAPRPTLASDLEQIPSPLGALTVELPLRDCGHVLPSWDELAELSAAARKRGVPFHIDGARLWESAQFLGHTGAEIADLGDSVYISLYKGLGGPAGAVLAGPDDLIADARRWRHRHGGNLPSLVPDRHVAGAARPAKVPAADGQVRRSTPARSSLCHRRVRGRRKRSRCRRMTNTFQVVPGRAGRRT